MAAKSLVLASHQKPTDKPQERIKRSAAYSLVRQLVAEWVIEPIIIRRLNTRPAVTPAAQRSPAGPYIPEKLPAALDSRMGIKVLIPALPGQVRFRSFNQPNL